MAAISGPSATGAAALAAHRPLNSIHRPPVDAVRAADDPPNSSASKRRQRRMTARKPPPPADRRVPRAAPTASVVTAVPSFDRPPTLRRFVSQFANDRRRRPQRPIPAGNFGAGPPPGAASVVCHWATGGQSATDAPPRRPIAAAASREDVGGSAGQSTGRSAPSATPRAPSDVSARPCSRRSQPKTPFESTPRRRHPPLLC